MKKLVVLLSFVLPLLLWQCNELKEWNDPTDNVPPGAISGVQVRNTNGGAVIIYTLPTDKDLLGVKAVYSYGENDEPKEAFASAFTDTIEVSGYPDTKTYTVQLYAVDKSGNLSVAVPAEIQPLTPPIDLIRQSLKVNGTFGGLYASWDNNFGDKSINLGITLLMKDSTGLLNVTDRYYSNMPQGKYSFRGYDSIPTAFRIELRDKHGNSAFMDTVITPLFEINIPGRDIYGNIWKQYGIDDGTARFRGDITKNVTDFNRIHDGVEAISETYWQAIVFENDFDLSMETVTGIQKVPFCFTIDMGKKAKYSRFKMWERSRAPLYSAYFPHDFEVWGTNNPKPISEIGGGDLVENLRYWTNWQSVGTIQNINGTNAWMNDGWEKLADCWLKLPSGITYVTDGTITSEDDAFIRAGFEFEINPEMTDKAFRYLRFYIRDITYGGDNSQITICEIKFYGAYSD
jgi:hypothetical protein